MAKMNAGWVITVLRSRGFPQPELGLLRQALEQLDGALADRLQASLTRIESGGGSTDEFDFVSIPGRVLTVKNWDGLQAAGVGCRPGPLLQYCLLHPDGVQVVRKAASADAAAIEALVKRFGTLLMSDQLEEAPEEAPTPSAPNRVRAVPRPSDPQKSEQSTAAAERRGTFAELQQIRGNTNHHVYGQKGALTFEVDIARADEGDPRQYTVRIEGARANQSGAYVWTDKVIFQLTRKELHQAAAVFLGFCEGAKFVGHGDGNEKWCELKSQSGGVFAKVAIAREVVAVPIGKEDLYEVAMLFSRVLFLNDPDIDQRVVLDVLRSTSRLLARIE